MAKQLSIDEMLEAARGAALPAYAYYVALVEATANILARDVADSLSVKCGEAKWEGLDMAGTCAPFSPLFEGQPIPEALRGLDTGGDWEYEEEAAHEPHARCNCLACDLAQAIAEGREALNAGAIMIHETNKPTRQPMKEALLTLVGLLEQNGDAIRKALSK